MSTPPQLEALHRAEMRLARELTEWRDAGGTMNAVIGAIGQYIDARAAYAKAQPRPACTICGGLLHVTGEHQDRAEPLFMARYEHVYSCMHGVLPNACPQCFPTLTSPNPPR
jgi:hypothetical protein